MVAHGCSSENGVGGHIFLYDAAALYETIAPYAAEMLNDDST